MKAIARGKKLTSRETARLLGVSEASVKRWADGGLLPMEKTAGGHRRFRPEDVALFRREEFREATRRAFKREAAAPRPRHPPDGGARNVESDGALADTLYLSLLDGQDEEASALLINLYLGGRGVASIADATVCAAMRRVGDSWHQGKLSVAEEHVATRAALTSLQALRASLDAPGGHGLLAVCCSTEEDFHELPVQAAALVLEGAGWEVVNLGTSTPFYALAEAVGRFAPRLVCVASTILHDLERSAREYAGVRAAAVRDGAAVALGGAGFSDAGVRRRFPAELHADDFRQLEEFAAALARDPSRAA